MCKRECTDRVRFGVWERECTDGLGLGWVKGECTDSVWGGLEGSVIK